MARPLRIVYPGAGYHVTARGNERRPIYRDNSDRQRFLDRLAEVVVRYRLILHAFVLMRNHVHLLLETPEANLSRALRQLNGVYTQDFNRRHRRIGHLFQGRYKALVVDKDAYLLELSRYIHLNPVRVGSDGSGGVSLEQRRRIHGHARSGGVPRSATRPEALRPESIAGAAGLSSLSGAHMLGPPKRLLGSAADSPARSPFAVQDGRFPRSA